jgi:inosine-uridine nucleoside N-ribohydrolase
MAKIVLVLCLLFLGACTSREDGSVPVLAPVAPASSLWVDADPVCEEGFVFSDPDDCLAIMMLRQVGVKVRGLSTTGGNARAEVTYRSGYQVAGNIPFYRGSPACDAPLHRAFSAEASRERITVLALGPLTNIANILRCEPALAPRIREIVFVGGVLVNSSLQIHGCRGRVKFVT